ncbi:hypothetical protein [Halalkalirubrum salinum]|uniref:hypothetical protein n=1 Tax=Halalkalirubrum salinum TaxID=2563889 RepID=UPI0010FAF836|nr:hypothetical protein [Halalkalirubrum salinum]
MPTIPKQALVGAVLLVIGVALFLPWIATGTGTIGYVGLAIAAVLLTVGTLLLGTSEGGRPV